MTLDELRKEISDVMNRISAKRSNLFTAADMLWLGHFVFQVGEPLLFGKKKALEGQLDSLRRLETELIKREQNSHEP